MTDEQILKQAIEKAVKNGFDLFDFQRVLSGTGHLYDNLERSLLGERTWSFLIFSHDFAKAFWGEEEKKYGVEDIANKNFEFDLDDPYICQNIKMKEWQYHLGQMVKEKEPLQYLKKFL